MRIKKKHVLIESNLLDTSSEFTPQEKRLLFVLNKQFGPHDYKTFNIWTSSLWLIELFEIPYDLAYEMANTYYYNGDKLFGESKTFRMVQNSTEIFFRHLGEMVTNYKKELMFKYSSDDDIVGDVDIDFTEDDYGIHKIEVLKRDIRMWDNSYGFTLYIPLRVNDIGSYPNQRYFYGRETDPRLIMVSVKFSEIKTPKEDDEYGYDGDPDKFKVNVEIRIGNDTRSGIEENGYTLSDWMSFEVPTPKPLSKEKINDTLSGIYNDVMEKLKKTKFNLPSGTEPIIISNG
jgi:hypothetical protein